MFSHKRLWRILRSSVASACDVSAPDKDTNTPEHAQNRVHMRVLFGELGVMRHISPVNIQKSIIIFCVFARTNQLVELLLSSCNLTDQKALILCQNTPQTDIGFCSESTVGRSATA